MSNRHSPNHYLEKNLRRPRCQGSVSLSESRICFRFFIEVNNFFKLTFFVNSLTYARVRRVQNVVWKFRFNLRVRGQRSIWKAMEHSSGKTAKLLIAIESTTLISGISCRTSYPIFVFQKLPIQLPVSVISEWPESIQCTPSFCMKRFSLKALKGNFDKFGGGVLKNRFLYFLTSCDDHSVEHVYRHHASVKFSVSRYAFSWDLLLFPKNNRMHIVFGNIELSYDFPRYLILDFECDYLVCVTMKETVVGIVRNIEVVL